MKERFRRFFSSEGMVAPAHRLGSLPDTRSAYQSVLHIALPAIAELVLVSLIGSMDTIMVGFLGKNALAAVALPTQPRMMILAMFFALNVGVTAIVARRKGEGRPEDANRTLRNAVLLTSGLSLVVMTFALLFAEPLMRLAGGNTQTADDAAVFKDAITYFKIMSLALPINAVSMCLNAALRGIGNTRLTLKVNVVSNLVNIFFNYLMIGGNLGFPRWEVAGAAIASVIGMASGIILLLWALMRGKDQYLHFSLKDDWRPHPESLKGILKVGSNSMLEQLSMRIGFFLYARIIYSLGVTMFASHNIAMQFLSLTFNFADGLAVAGTTLVGQNMGKNRPDLSLLYGKAAQRIAMFLSVGLGAFIVIMRYPISELFINAGTPDAELVIFHAAEAMLVVAAMQPFQMASIILSGCLRGAGDNLFVAYCMMFCVTLLRPILAAVSVYTLHLSLAMTWLVSLSEILIRLVLFYRRFESGKWMKIRI